LGKGAEEFFAGGLPWWGFLLGWSFLEWWGEVEVWIEGLFLIRLVNGDVGGK